MIDNLRSFHQYRYELPLLSAPVEWEFRQTPVDPYSLGLLLGDGCITDKTSPSFCTADVELVSSLESALAKMSLSFCRKSKFDYVITNPAAGKGGYFLQMPRNPLTQALRELNLSGTKSATKFVPEIYLYNCAEVRHAVLQGLLDTDGGPVTQTGRTCRVQYVTTSERLKDDVLFLTCSLGGVAYWRRRKAEGRKPGFAGGREIPYRHDAFVLDIRLPKGIEPFRLKRKSEIYRENGGRPARFIKSIEPVGDMETRCISVAALDSLYVTDDFILTHNTLADSFIILDEAQNTTSEQMKMLLTRIGFGSKCVVTGDVTQIDLPAGRGGSGLVEAMRILANVPGIEFVGFTEKDVVRHRLVQMIIRAYEEHSGKNQSKNKSTKQTPKSDDDAANPDNDNDRSEG